MDTQLVTELAESRPRRALRSVAVLMIGPITVAGAAVWAVLQPYRLVILHPRGHGVWALLAEPPLLAAMAGVVFALLVAPGLADDVERSVALRGEAKR